MTRVTHILYAATMLLTSSLAAMAQTPDIIRTQPEGELHTYLRDGGAFYAYYGEATMTTQQGTIIDIVTASDGKTIYMKNPISQATAGTWVKGSLGDDGKIHIPLGQCVQYFDMGYGWKTTVLKLYSYDDWSGASYYIDDAMQEVTFTTSADGSTITMDSLGDIPSQGGYPGAMYALVYTDDDSFVGYADYESVYTPFDMTFVTIPEGLDSQNWAFTYSNAQEGEVEMLPAAKDGDKLYIAGLSLHDPAAAIVGNIEGNHITFPSEQYVGHHSGFLLYALGASYETKTFYDDVWDETYTTNVMTPESAIEFIYDENTHKLSPIGDMALILNMGRLQDQSLNYLSVSLDPEFQSPDDFTLQSPDGINAATATTTSPTYYDLNGRRLTSPTCKGVTIIRMKEGKNRKVVRR